MTSIITDTDRAPRLNTLHQNSGVCLRCTTAARVAMSLTQANHPSLPAPHTPVEHKCVQGVRRRTKSIVSSSDSIILLLLVSQGLPIVFSAQSKSRFENIPVSNERARRTCAPPMGQLCSLADPLLHSGANRKCQRVPDCVSQSTQLSRLTTQSTVAKSRTRPLTVLAVVINVNTRVRRRPRLFQTSPLCPTQ